MDKHPAETSAILLPRANNLRLWSFETFLQTSLRESLWKAAREEDKAGKIKDNKHDFESAIELLAEWKVDSDNDLFRTFLKHGGYYLGNVNDPFSNTKGTTVKKNFVHRQAAKKVLEARKQPIPDGLILEEEIPSGK